MIIPMQHFFPHMPASLSTDLQMLYPSTAQDSQPVLQSIQIASLKCRSSCPAHPPCNRSRGEWSPLINSKGDNPVLPLGTSRIAYKASGTCLGQSNLEAMVFCIKGTNVPCSLSTTPLDLGQYAVVKSVYK